MSSLGVELRGATAQNVTLGDDSFTVTSINGRTLGVPIVWFPRLEHGSLAERTNWRLIGGGSGIHWPDLDEDISVESLLAGRKSGESAESLGRWLANRDAQPRDS